MNIPSKFLKKDNLYSPPRMSYGSIKDTAWRNGFGLRGLANDRDVMEWRLYAVVYAEVYAEGSGVARNWFYEVFLVSDKGVFRLFESEVNRIWTS